MLPLHRKNCEHLLLTARQQGAWGQGPCWSLSAKLRSGRSLDDLWPFHARPIPGGGGLGALRAHSFRQAGLLSFWCSGAAQGPQGLLMGGSPPEGQIQSPI